MALLNLEPLGPRADPALWRGLTRQQAAVLELVASGLSNVEVGERLFICRGTVKFHLSAVSDRLGLCGRVRLARWWWEHVDLPAMMGEV